MCGASDSGAPAPSQTTASACSPGIGIEGHDDQTDPAMMSNGIMSGASKTKQGRKFEAPLYLLLPGYLFYVFVFAVSWIGEAVETVTFLILGRQARRGHRYRRVDKPGYAPICSRFEWFFVQHIYRRLKECVNVPIGGVPGATVTLVERVFKDGNRTFQLNKGIMLNGHSAGGCKANGHLKPPTLVSTRTDDEYINLVSYNYLGFSESSGYCTDRAIRSCQTDGLAVCSPPLELGTRGVHLDLERKMAEFMGTEDAILVGMGFCTNTLNIPSLVSDGCLVVSDENNHASLILAMRISGATIKVFKHNDPESLEQVLRSSLIRGQDPNTFRPWKKALIVVEGVYSMEGTICPLPEIVAIKKKYGAYLYLDEAHSVGSMGPRGRGVVDHFGLNPKDIDIQMGTFTKSFAAMGGYIAGTRQLIDYLRTTSHARFYGAHMSPPVARKILSVLERFEGISGGIDSPMDGLQRVRQLEANCKYLRDSLVDMGFTVISDEGSPVIALMVYTYSKVFAVMKRCRKAGVAVIGVELPASKIAHGRIRLCVSASHSREMLDRALEVLGEAGDYALCK